MLKYSDESDLGSEFNGFLFSGEGDEGFLGSVWSDEGIDSLDLDIESVLESFLNLVFVSSQFDDEYKSILVFHQFRSGLSNKRILDDRVRIVCSSLSVRMLQILSSSLLCEGGWSSESGLSPDFGSLLLMGSFLDVCSSFIC